MGRVYGVKVRSAKSNGDYNAHFNDGDGTVTLDKLTQNLILMSNIKRGEIEFWQGSQTDPDIAEFINHTQNVVFRTDEKENPQTHLIEYERVVLRKGGDHSFQTMVYAFVGLDKLMKEYANTNMLDREIAYLDPATLEDKTDLQSEVNANAKLLDSIDL